MKELDEVQAKREVDAASRFADKNQRLSWKRKLKRMEELVERIKPFEEEILDVIKRQQPLMDEINALREQMVHECVHPSEHVVHKGTHMECKFCKRRLKRVSE